MKLLKRSIWVLAASMFVFTSCDKEDEKEVFKLGDKEGILLVTFGSSYEAPQLTFNTIDKAAKEKYSGEEIRWGFTSDIILNKLRQGNGEGILNGKVIDNNTPEEALKMMAEDGYASFSIQSLHVIPGEEFDELNEAIEEFKHKYTGVEVSVGRPLLDTDVDIASVAKIMADKFATQIIDGPVLFMGHGTPHASNDRYGKLEAELQKIDPNFFVGTVEGTSFDSGISSIGGILTKLDALVTQPTKVTISPLMSIAGDHANNDMNGVTGEEDVNEQSWRERLEGAGYTVDCVMKGLGDYPEINALWLKHLESIKK